MLWLLARWFLVGLLNVGAGVSLTFCPLLETLFSSLVAFSSLHMKAFA